ncbi:MAG TPA: ABC transporter ATP-binding protein [bacterium]|jgi:NitT/TauT family transport system ATP-binding protein|nr:ABC transporter ATP-binding protein [bacterium]
MRVTCDDLSLSYEARGRRVEALGDVTFSVEEQEILCVLGPSGCGKTTLLKIIAGLLRPQRGRVTFTGERNGNPLTAMVFQDHGLFPWMTVMENVAFGLAMRGLRRAEQEERSLPLLERAGLARFARSYPHELSIGMKQRAGLLRAIVTDPTVLLMDEPFASLDAQTKLILQDELLRILRDFPRPVIYVTHDIDEAILLGDRIIVLTGRPGRVSQEFAVTLPRPRSLALLQSPDFAWLKGEIWKSLETSVREQARQ